MTYPQPLSEKTLERLYSEAQLSEEVRVYFHRLFKACANLYGAVSVQDIWAMHKVASWKFPKFRRKDLISFSAIVRREEQPYYVFEIDEIYKDEPRTDLDRYVVSRQLVRFGYYRFISFYALMDSAIHYPYYIPDDILAYEEPVPSYAEKAFLTFIGQLRVTAKVVEDGLGQFHPCEHRRKLLKDFSFMNSIEREVAESLKKTPKKLAEFMEMVSGSVAEKIVRNFKREDRIGLVQIMALFKEVMNELEEVGVRVTENQLQRILRLLMDFHNSLNLWCLAGWSPKGLGERSEKYDGPPTITFGAGLKRAFAEGSVNKEELVRRIQELGMDVADIH